MASLQEQARALGDPTRHSIFDQIAASDGPLGVAELTEHCGLNHNAVRQHLAKLVAADLVAESTAPAAGPGRPRLQYVIDPNIDGRWGRPGPYERLSIMLAEALRTGETPVEVGRRSGRRQQSLAPSGEGAIDTVTATIARDGFEPRIRRRGKRIEITLDRCPFEASAVADPGIICELHRGLVEGLVEGSDRVDLNAFIAKDPRRARCRLALQVDDQRQ